MKVIREIEHLIYLYSNIFDNLIFHNYSISHYHLKKLNDLLSKEICSMLKDRIILLGKEGLPDLWIKPSGNDIFNAGSLLGYLNDEWE